MSKQNEFPVEKALVSHIFPKGKQAVAVIPELGHKILVPASIVHATEMRVGEWFEFSLKSNENPTADCTYFAVRADRVGLEDDDG